MSDGTVPATLYWGRNDLKAAQQTIKSTVDLSPPRSPVRLRYVDFLLRTGATGEAKNILEEINRNTPDYLPAGVYLMKMACRERRSEDCATHVQNILAQDATNYDALFVRGTLALDMQRKCCRQNRVDFQIGSRERAPQRHHCIGINVNQRVVTFIPRY